MTNSINISIGSQTSTHLTIQQAAIYSGYNEQYLSRMLRYKKIAGFKFGHIWMVEVASLEEFMSDVELRRTSDLRFGARRTPSIRGSSEGKE